jgi:hypothetical protein
MEVRTEPTNEASPRIKRKLRPLDNPSSVLEVLHGILVIKEGVAGNNVTTGPLQYQYWRTCLEGTALNKFNEFAQQVGNETTAHLVLVERRLVTYFAPHEVLNQQARYIRHYMRKPTGISTRQYVSAVHVLNNMIGQLPPAFEANQEILEPDLMDILVSNAPKTHRQLMVEHGFNPQTATTEEFVEICERAENKDALQTNRKRSDDDSSEDERPTKKITKKNRTSDYVTSKRSPFYCKVHGPNSTHNSKDCKVSLETEKNPMTGRRKTLPTVRTIKRSKRRNIANLTCFNSRPNERKRSGRKPTRSLRNPLGLMQSI